MMTIGDKRRRRRGREDERSRSHSEAAGARVRNFRPPRDVFFLVVFVFLLPLASSRTPLSNTLALVALFLCARVSTNYAYRRARAFRLHFAVARQTLV